MGRPKFKRWAGRGDCWISGGKLRRKRPKGTSYQGMNERGSLYFRKRDSKTFLQTRRCKNGKPVWIEL